MDDENKIAYIKHYFDNYLVKVSKEELEYYIESFKKKANIFYLRGKRPQLLKAGFSFLAYKQTYKDCYKMKGYDLLESFFNRTEESNPDTFYGIPENNLIIYHLRGTTANNKLVSLIRHLITFRAVDNKKTLILSEDDIFLELQDGETEIINLNKEEEANIDSF